MTRIKICGLIEAEHARAATGAGADFIGVVFAEGRRTLTPEKASEIVQAVHAMEKSPGVVGVFAGHSVAEVNQVAERCNLDRIQLSGGEGWSFCQQITRPVTRTIHIGPETTVEQVLKQINEGKHTMHDRDIYFLLDTKLGNASGGTGQTFNWEVARRVAREYPVMLAGGLTPDNVNEAIRTIRPWGVDVSSGVETGGKKDIKKIMKFIEAVRQADAGTR